MSFSAMRRFALQLFALIVLCVGAGFALLLLVNCLPSEPIEEHVRLSSYTLEREGEYPQVDTINGRQQMDNFTDAIMLTEAAFDDGRGVVEHTLRTPYILIDNLSPYASFVQYYNRPAEAHGEPVVTDYTRYWHGYLVFLRPLLLFFRLYQIRKIYLVVQMALAALLAVLMVRRRLARFIPAFAITIALLSPFIIADSLQFSSVYFIALAACCALLLFTPRIGVGANACLFFALIGVTTSYIDFLTAPLMTLYFPLALFFCLHAGSIRQNALRFAALCGCWAAGYVGMWAGKWLLATVILRENVFASAAGAFSMHSSFIAPNGNAFTYAQVLEKNWSFWAESPLHAVVLLLMLVCLALILRKHAAGRLPASLCAFAPIALLPFGWFMVASSHTYWHAFFAYRAFGALPLGLMCAMFAPLGRKTSPRA